MIVPLSRRRLRRLPAIFRRAILQDVREPRAYDDVGRSNSAASMEKSFAFPVVSHLKTAAAHWLSEKATEHDVADGINFLPAPNDGDLLKNAAERPCR